VNAPLSYQLLEFSSANLFGALSNKSCDRNEVAANPRAQYLIRYLHDVGAKFIVVEKNYTDGDYLDDFASYYARCFTSYKPRCKRLHFFGCELDEHSLRGFVTRDQPSETTNSIRDAYLGFVVARPLPIAVVGRTLLRTYDADGDRRHYPVVRTYPAHLFGAALSIQSLPFQEQDTVLAACATVALWSAFHKTAELFGTTAPRPAAITNAANRAGHRGRPIPSHGLRIEEMCHAIRSVGLEPELVDWVGTRVPLVSLAYAYLRAGLPVILGVQIGAYLHALTLTGYSLRDKVVHARELPKGYQYLPLIGLRIDELYGHDDQVGPFSRLRIDTAANPNSVVLLSDTPGGGQRQMEPTAALIPVYNKIRVTFQDMLGWLRRLHVVVEATVSDPAKAIEWDLHLITTNDYKEEIGGSTALSLAQRERLLFKQQPRFLWRALLRIAGTKALELLADSTGLGRSLPFIEAVWYHQKFKGSMKGVVTAAATQGTLSDILTPRFLDFLKKRL
jgi:hypothetical protein